MILCRLLLDLALELPKHLGDRPAFVHVSVLLTTLDILAAGLAGLANRYDGPRETQAFLRFGILT